MMRLGESWHRMSWPYPQKYGGDWGDNVVWLPAPASFSRRSARRRLSRGDNETVRVVPYCRCTRDGAAPGSHGDVGDLLRVGRWSLARISGGNANDMGPRGAAKVLGRDRAAMSKVWHKQQITVILYILNGVGSDNWLSLIGCDN